MKTPWTPTSAQVEPAGELGEGGGEQAVDVGGGFQPLPQAGQDLVRLVPAPVEVEELGDEGSGAAGGAHPVSVLRGDQRLVRHVQADHVRFPRRQLEGDVAGPPMLAIPKTALSNAMCFFIAASTSLSWLLLLWPLIGSQLPPIR